MKAVTSALAGGVITPGEAGTIAAVVDVFFRAIETSDLERRSKEAEDGLSRNSGAAPRSGVGRSSQLSDEVLLQICCRSSKRSVLGQLLVETRHSRSGRLTLG